MTEELVEADLICADALNAKPIRIAKIVFIFPEPFQTQF
jgi:hypothetical protein